MSLFNNTDLLIQTKKIRLNSEVEFKFKALTTNNLFYLFNEFPSFINYLFSGVTLNDKEKFTNEVFLKYPKASAVILSLCVIDEEDDIFKKARIFEELDINFQLEALHAVVDLTFKSGVAETIKKWQSHLNQILEVFFQAKEEMAQKD